MMTAPFVLITGIFCLVMGFRGAMDKATLEINKQIREENKEILTDIANTNAEIYKGSIGTIAKEVADNINNAIYCKHCGAKIDGDSKFCKVCGKQL